MRSLWTRCSEDSESLAWRDLRVPREKSTEAGTCRQRFRAQGTRGALEQGGEVGGETTLEEDPGNQSNRPAEASALPLPKRVEVPKAHTPAALPECYPSHVLHPLFLLTGLLSSH